MAVNLVSQILQFLSPDMMARLASALGLDRTKTQAAAGAAVPALLSGLLGTAAQPGGPERLTNAVNQQSGLLDGLTGMLGGSGEASGLVDSGSRLVTSLLGEGKQAGLAEAIGKFSGLGQSGAGPLLGAIAPMVLGVIGKQAGPGGFDPLALVSLLSSQKENIAKAMPAGLGNLLQGTGVLDSLGGLADNAAGAASAAADRASSATTAAASQASQAGASARSGMGWLAWAIPVVLLLGVGWLFLGTRPPTPPVDTVVTGSIPVVVIRGIDVTKELGGSLTSVYETLDDVTDAASAEAAVPKLRAADAQLGVVSGALAEASPAQKLAIANTARRAVNQLQLLFDKVMAIPGASEALKPTIDTMKTKLAAIVA